MTQNTKQAKQMLRNTVATLQNIEKSSDVLELDNLQAELFLLQNAMNLLTKKINLAIISWDEAGAEAYVDTLEDIDNKVKHG